MDETGKRHFKRSFLIAPIITVLLTMLVLGAGIFYNYVSKQLYSESLSQLREVGGQMFEKLEFEIDLQWDYLSKTEAKFETKGEWSENEAKEIFTHYQEDLSPTDSTILLRAIDEEGRYFTSSGRLGEWPGLDQLDNSEGKDKQSFLIANWYEEPTYMTFVSKADKDISIGGRKITHFALLRKMDDLKEFFTSTTFDNENITYIIKYNGSLLYQTGKVQNLSFEGSNVFAYLRKQTFLHDSYDSLAAEANKGNTVASDIEINGNKFFLLYNPFPGYDWGVLLLVPSNKVATSATSMVSSLIIVFVVFLLVFLVSMVAGLLFIGRIQKDHALLKVKEESGNKLMQVNAALEKANAGLESSKKKTEEALEEARYATKAKSQFLANMSHDIRTPMNAIVGIAKLMEHELNNPEKQSYYLAKLETSSAYMLGLVNDILDMSKIESGDVSLNVEPVKMAEQVGQIESIIRSQANEKNQQFDVYVHELKHEYILGDSVRLRQLFLNLLTNAVKYTPSEGHIRFELKEFPCDKQGYACILTSVIDDGLGMSEEFQRHMFEPFAREDNSMIRKISGTGLGLSITKSIVDLMGGTIEVSSALGKGSRFDVWLTVPIDPKPPVIPFIKDLLLVSKEEMLVENVKAALSERDLALHVASSEEEAVSFLKEHEAQAILLSGYLEKETLKKTLTSLKSVAKKAMFVFCCDYTHKDHIRDLLVESGIDGLIARPFFVENLILAIDHASKEALPEEETRSSLSGKRFLCAEDNDLNAEILEALLTLHGASCTIYPNGEELLKAFSSAKEGDYDAILMDVQMPVMNGLEASKKIRDNENILGKSIPIIAMTANAFASDIQECLDAGMDAHLAKPLDIKALEHLLQTLLGR